ncbi:hypothetical protein ATY77_19725 [Rhizobium sp. R634]|uniref:DUF4261 domain-containing protein n=1 Tax=Rhizobium sp. R634 TaxID=1764274 RepID=UPI000B532925|nr:DUF4261 domain-containing protein [Rhizobium sp. R634]OWV69408.1 hypothetical protein ATY77_19725 [Rhizobium sp. R634]
MPIGNQEENKGAAMAALVFLSESKLSDSGNLLHLLRNAFPSTNIGTDATASARETPIVFVADGLLCTVMHIEAPAPIREADPEIRNARFWPTAWSEISRHRSHVVVTVVGGDAIPRAMVLQRILAAVFEAERSAIGSAYPSSGALLPRKVAQALLKQTSQVAVPLFVSCFFAKEADNAFPMPSILASTKGLADFGVREVEARGYPGSVSELHGFIFDFAGYLIQARPDLRDGHTVGVSKTQKVPVSIERSLFYQTNVYCLRFQ